MPKKKSKVRNVADRSREELVFKDEDQHYAHVVKSLGSGRFEIECDDGTARVGKLRGNMRKSQWVSAGAVVLVSYRDFGSDTAAEGKADILLKYSDAGIKQLRRYGELDWLVKKTRAEDDDDTDGDDLVVFDEIDIAGI